MDAPILPSPGDGPVGPTPAGPGPQQFSQLSPDRQAGIRRNIATMQAGGASDDDIEDYLTNHEHLASAPKPTPGFLTRGVDDLENFGSQFVHHPLDTVSSLVAAPLKSLNTAMAPGSARDVTDLNRLGATGKSGSVGVLPYRTADIVTPKQRAVAVAQTLANVAAPSVGGFVSGVARPVVGKALSSLAGLGVTGGTIGATYNPDDPSAGFVSGMMAAPAMSLGSHLAARGAGLMSYLASKGLDVAGRPAETTPVMSVMGKPVLSIQSAAERAGDLNAQSLANAPADAGLPPTSQRPAAALDVLGTPGVRLARGLKTASPSAEAVFRQGFDDRASGAVDRVIQHGLEATGLASRENGLQVVDDMIAQRAQHGNANYQPVFAAYPDPLDDPTFAKVAKTPAGQQAVKRAGILAANRGEMIGSTVAPPTMDPATLAPDKQALYVKLLQLNGGQVEPTLAAMRTLGETISSDPAATPSQLAPTLKQAHYVKLAFDDMLNSAPEPGSGGMGPNNASAIRGLKGQWLAAMDKAAPEYADARQTYADESDLIRGAQLGRNLWKLHPAEAEKAFNELPSDARDVARRTGFDALAERIENGPTDVERSVGKPRDQRRMRLLFPDDASFGQFKQGLSDEAQLYANGQAVLGGSNTADKFADIANMAGVGLPDVVRAAATGRWHQLAGRALANVVRGGMFQNADALAGERAKLLIAGANGDPAARSSALARMLQPRLNAPLPGSMSAVDVLRAMGSYALPRALPAAASTARADRQP